MFGAAVENDGPVQDIGKNLHPHGASRRTADEGQGLRTGLRLLEAVLHIGKSQGDAFEGRLGQVRAARGMAQAKEGGSEIRIVMRGAFAREIGKKEERGWSAHRRQGEGGCGIASK
jgi:hypothetical protein